MFMDLFHEPNALVTAFKDRVESTIVFGNRLFIGTALGTVITYSLNFDAEVTATLTSTKTLSRKPIEQLAFLQDLSSLVVLTDATLSLNPLPDLTPPSPLTQARYVFSFAVNSSIEHTKSTKHQTLQNSANEASEDIPCMLTRLVVGCRRRLVVYSWRDGEMQQFQEANLPFSPRSVAFLKSNVVCLVNNASEYFMFYLDTMSLSEVIVLSANNPISAGIGSISMGALTGLGGYMNLGLGSKIKPTLVPTEDGEILVRKDSNGFFLESDGKPSKERLVDWHTPPDEVAYIKPYILAAISTGSAAANLMSQSTALPSPILQIRSSLSNKVLQNLAYPFTSSPVSTSAHYVIRLLTTSPSMKGFLFAITTPTERNTIAAEGSTIWCFRLRSWSEQIDDYIKRKEYDDALALLHTLDVTTLPDKDVRIRQSSILRAVSQFEDRNYDSAMDTFIELDVNPAKVVALFPEEISGRLFASKDSWIPIFGGPKSPAKESATTTEEENAQGNSNLSQLQSTEVREQNEVVSNATVSPPTEGDVMSISGEVSHNGDLTRSVETLVRYLSDRRPKIKGALESIHIVSADSHKFPFLSETSVEELMALPDNPISSLTTEQKIRFAQIVDTALFKSYLIIRPKLLASLCRLDNWCEVSEVEEVLLAREKYPELMFLYNGKKMHGKALALLKSLSEKVNDKREKLTPTITYLQNLGADYLDQIFEASRWVFQQDSEMAFEIFTTEQRELPRSAVADFLEEIDSKQCAKYLEHCISEWGENSTLIHDRLAELYLDLITIAKRQDGNAGDTEYKKFLEFINTSTMYRADRLFGLLPRNDLFEARAILLGRLGKHEAALETYVYRLHDYIKAEEYCKRIHQSDSSKKDIFLTLLKIYLQPPPQYSTTFLGAALELIRRQSRHLDVIETLQILPPLVPAEDVKAILYDALRQPVFDTKILREIAKARNEEVKMQLMHLENKRVLVTDDRICPQCHKRIGNNSVIAVHTPRGEVTHYQCREGFTARQAEKADK